MKRSLALAAAAVALVVSATPVSAASTTFHMTDQGNGLLTAWTNVPWDAAQIPAGTYWEVDLNAASSLNNGSKSYTNGFCVMVIQWAFDAQGNGQGIGQGSCGDASSLLVDNKLTSATIVGSLPYQACLAWDQYFNCTSIGPMQTLAVNVTVTGTGPLFRNHSTGTSGTAGYLQWTSHGTEMDRAGVASGTVTLDGASLIGGGTSMGAQLFLTRSGQTQVWICRPKVGC